MSRVIIVALMALLTGLGCHESAPDAAADDPTPAPEPGTVLETPYVPPSPPIEQTQVTIARTLKFARQTDGVSLGFDLDGRNSDRSDREGCYQQDFTGPDGAEGIDNAFAHIVPLIERVGGQALETLVQSAINEGDMLVAIELDGVDSMENDDHVTLTLMRALGRPFVATDGLLEPHQTFDVDVEAPWSKTDARITNGVLRAEGITVDLPIYVFDFEFLVTVLDARIDVGMGPSGPTWAVIGGIVTMDNVLYIANNIEGGQNIPGTLDTVGRTFADMRHGDEEACDALSVVVDIDLTRGYFYDDVVRPDR